MERYYNKFDNYNLKNQRYIDYDYYTIENFEKMTSRRSIRIEY